jgi:D-arabinose 1-dehydrogenase-like Zn-dependent alcohol dehydrogenase
VLVGLFGGEPRLSLVTMPTRAYRIIGSYTGSLNDMVELVSLAKRDIIKPIVSNRFKLDQAGKALQMLKDGKIVGMRRNKSVTGTSSPTRLFTFVSRNAVTCSLFFTS